MWVKVFFESIGLKIITTDYKDPVWGVYSISVPYWSWNVPTVPSQGTFFTIRGIGL